MNLLAFPAAARLGRSLVLVVFGAVAFLAGCGGGDYSAPAAAPAYTTISGTAAAGAPIIGSVTIKDSSSPAKTKTAVISADGKYTVDVSGMTGPFMMRADGTVGGRSYSLYSAATSADVGGTINVTPLTDLIVANIAGQIASTYFASGNFSGLTAAALATETNSLRARLQPILTALGVGSSIDLLRASFNADHSGLDAALDVLRVEVNSTTAKATITNIIDNIQIIDDLASRSDSSVLSQTNVASAFTDFQQILQKFDALSQLFATSVPASNNAALNAIFATDFLDDGQNRASFLSEVTSSPQNVGIKFTNVTLLGSMSPSTSPTAATLSFVVDQQGRKDTHVFRAKKVSGAWVMAGNGRIAKADALTFARLQNVTSIDSGLLFEIKDSGLLGISYAIVKGKGLPVNGALYVNFINNSSFGAATTTGVYTGSSTLRLRQDGYNQFPLDDTAIGLIGDNEVYTIELWKDNGIIASPGATTHSLQASYTDVVPKRPYLRSELTGSSFAVITAPTSQALYAFGLAGGTIPVTWTLPAGKTSSDLHYFSSGSSGGPTTSIDLAAAATSTSITMTPWLPGSYGTYFGNGMNLTIQDSFGRELVTIFNGSP